MDLINIYRTYHPKTREYNFFSSAHGTFSRIDHIQGHKSRLSEFKKTEIISSIFSNHNAVRVDINYREKSVKHTNTWRLNNTLLNNEEITEEIKEEIWILPEKNETLNLNKFTYFIFLKLHHSPLNAPGKQDIIHINKTV